MNASIFKGYVLIIFSGLVLLAAAILAVLQWGNYGQFSLYGKNLNRASTLAVMLASAAGGVVVLYLSKVMYHGIRSLLKGRRQQRQRQTEQAVVEMQRKSAPPPA